MLPSESSLGRLGLTTAWMGYATIDSVRDRVKYFMSDEQVTVVESQTGMVTTFDNATGRRRWAVQVGAATDTRFAPTTTEQAVIVISGRKVFGLDKRNGDAVWEADCPNAPSTSAATDEQLAYVGSIDGSVFAFDLKFLSGLAKDITLRKYMYRALKWTYRTGGRVPYACVDRDDRVHSQRRRLALRPGRQGPQDAISIRDRSAVGSADRAARQSDCRGHEGYEGLQLERRHRRS